MKPTIIIATNTAWNLSNFRLGLINALLSAGYEVIAVAPSDEYAEKIKSLGCQFMHVPMDGQGINPFRDIFIFLNFLRLLRKVRPVSFLSYTVKPNVYGSLAANVVRVPVINNIAGLGAVFIRGGWFARFVGVLYRIALNSSFRVFFQNPEDLKIFVENGFVKKKIAHLLPGSGVNLEHFKSGYSYSISVAENCVPSFRFILVARMLWDKGVGEYIDAARIIRKSNPNIRFGLLGFLDVANPSAISLAQMDAWVTEGIVEYLGTTDDVRPYLDQADCVVLPSYREGTPRSLLEAAAMARPIITTDAAGCREVVVNGVNGFLCEPKNSVDLASKMKKMIAMSAPQRIEMGKQGRLKIEREFDEQIVIKKYLKAIAEITTSKVV